MKRKARNKIKKKGIDFMQALDITVFGSEDDPCFGKLNDPVNKVCRSCGDSEVCAIVMTQRMHAIRATEATKQPFKDLEEPNMDIKTIDRFITSTLATKGAMSFSKLLVLGYKHFMTFEQHTKEEVGKQFKAYVIRADKFKKYMKEGKKYIKLA